MQSPWPGTGVLTGKSLEVLREVLSGILSSRAFPVSTPVPGQDDCNSKMFEQVMFLIGGYRRAKPREDSFGNHFWRPSKRWFLRGSLKEKFWKSLRELRRELVLREGGGGGGKRTDVRRVGNCFQWACEVLPPPSPSIPPLLHSLEKSSLVIQTICWKTFEPSTKPQPNTVGATFPDRLPNSKIRWDAAFCLQLEASCLQWSSFTYS